MDTPTDVETLRQTLKGMARKDVLKLAAKAQVSASTVQKFRSRLIAEPGAFKVQALLRALQEEAREAKPASRRKAAAV